MKSESMDFVQYWTEYGALSSEAQIWFKKTIGSNPQIVQQICSWSRNKARARPRAQMLQWLPLGKTRRERKASVPRGPGASDSVSSQAGSPNLHPPWNLQNAQLGAFIRRSDLMNPLWTLFPDPWFARPSSLMEQAVVRTWWRFLSSLYNWVRPAAPTLDKNWGGGGRCMCNRLFAKPAAYSVRPESSRAP